MTPALVTLTVMLATATAAAAQVTPDRPRIHAHIRALVDSGTAAWNRGNMEGYLAGYWNSPMTRWAGGARVIRGKQAIVAMFKARFPSPERMGSFTVASLDIEPLTESDALVFGHWFHTVGGAQRRGLFTVHLRRFDGKWFVVSDHSSTAGVNADLNLNRR